MNATLCIHKKVYKKVSAFRMKAMYRSPISVVRDFITVDFRWYVDLLSLVLSKEEVDLVPFIPLSKRPMEDRIIWHCGNKGKFTIKSAFHVAKNWILTPSLAASFSTLSCPFDGLWEKLWKADIPPKVKMIAWRLLSNIVPTAANLIRKHIPIDPHCTLYGSKGETTRHLLLDGLGAPNGTNFESGRWVLMMIWAIGSARNSKFWVEILNPMPNIVACRAFNW
ncbi:hypothetical protein COP1_035189 [Malus domestica]